MENLMRGFGVRLGVCSALAHDHEVCFLPNSGTMATGNILPELVETADRYGRGDEGREE